jgi:hypothetical protein
VPLLVFLLMALAAYRVTRLLVADQFPPVEVQRERIAARYGNESWQAYLSRCPWCAGVYVSAITVGLTDLAASVPLPVLTIPALSAVVGLLSAIDVALDRE